jgi:hypothetical protein
VARSGRSHHGRTGSSEGSHPAPEEARLSRQGSESPSRSWPSGPAPSPTNSSLPSTPGSGDFTSLDCDRNAIDVLAHPNVREPLKNPRHVLRWADDHWH